MHHLVQFSTGLGSAEVARRVYAAAQPADRVVLLTADTKVEDEDNWRFARQVAALMPGAEWVVLADGRTPMQVGRDARCVPNDRLAVCSRVLKRELLRDHLDATYDPATSVVYLGFDWTEDHRLKAARPHWAPWTIEAPLNDPPYVDKHTLRDRFRTLGIEPPRLYAAGFAHANCGGACVRAGQTEWSRLLHWNRARYLEWEAEEEGTRRMLGKNVTILRDRSDERVRPLSLRTFRERLERDASLFDIDDVGACGCEET